MEDKKDTDIHPICDLISKLASQEVPTAAKTQCKALLNILNQPTIDIKKLSQISFNGIPSECKGLRALVWEVLLGVVSNDPSNWNNELENHKASYITAKKSHLWFENFTEESKGKVEPNSPKEIAVQCIEKDAHRTFIQDTSKYKIDMLIRVVTLYVILHNNCQYISGMTFVYRIIYETIMENALSGYEGFAESEIFYCFVAVMNLLGEEFSPVPANMQHAVIGKLQEVNNILHRLDPEVWNQLQTLQILPEMFGYRWVLVNFAHEFPLKPTQRLWDSILSESGEKTLVKYMSAALVISQRERILANDFAEAIMALNEAPKKVSVEEILLKVIELKNKDLHN